MFHPYVISLDNDKYRVINDNGLLRFLRHGEPWFPAEEPGGAKVVLAMAQRIEELEVAIGEVLDGTIDTARGERRADGVRSFGTASGLIPLRSWENTLRRALEQK